MVRSRGNYYSHPLRWSAIFVAVGFNPRCVEYNECQAPLGAKYSLMNNMPLPSTSSGQALRSGMREGLSRLAGASNYTGAIYAGY
jgi:hypothetical protein